MEKFEKAKSWFETAQKNGVPFSKFTLLYISYEILYKSLHRKHLQFNEDYKTKFSEVVESHKKIFFQFQEYIKYKEINPGFIDNLEPGKGKSNAKYEDLENIQQYLHCIFVIRNNFIHGDKSSENTQDIRLVSFATQSLEVFLSNLFKKN